MKRNTSLFFGPILEDVLQKYLEKVRSQLQKFLKGGHQIILKLTGLILIFEVSHLQECANICGSVQWCPLGTFYSCISFDTKTYLHKSACSTSSSTPNVCLKDKLGESEV